MTPFEKGFRDELEKIAIELDPAVMQQLMAQAPVPPAAAALLTPENIKAIGGTALGGLHQYLTPTREDHVYASHTPRAAVSGFRY